MTLNELLNTLLTEGPYQNEVPDILADFNLGQGGRKIKVEINDGPDKQTHPAVLHVDGLEIRLTENKCEDLQVGLWAALTDAHAQSKEANHVEI